MDIKNLEDSKYISITMSWNRDIGNCPYVKAVLLQDIAKYIVIWRNTILLGSLTNIVIFYHLYVGEKKNLEILRFLPKCT